MASIMPYYNDSAITPINGNIQLEHPHQAWQHKGIEAIHWGFEFAQGTKIQLNGITLTAPRTSRFYPCWNPVNEKLLLSPLFKKGVSHFIDQFSHFIVSGYQLLSPNYPDGTTCIDYMLSTLSYLNKLKVARPTLKLHFECDTIPVDAIRNGIRKHVLPQMDSMGLNEVELDYFIKDMHGQTLNQLNQENSVEYYFGGLVELATKSGLEKLFDGVIPVLNGLTEAGTLIENALAPLGLPKAATLLKKKFAGFLPLG